MTMDLIRNRTAGSDGLFAFDDVRAVADVCDTAFSNQTLASLAFAMRRVSRVGDCFDYVHFPVDSLCDAVNGHGNA